MSRKDKVLITERALLQRVNRRLMGSGERLKVARGKAAQDVGRFYLLNVDKNILMRTRIDLACFANKLGVIQPWEEL